MRLEAGASTPREAECDSVAILEDLFKVEPICQNVADEEMIMRPTDDPPQREAQEDGEKQFHELLQEIESDVQRSN